MRLGEFLFSFQDKTKRVLQSYTVRFQPFCPTDFFFFFSTTLTVACSLCLLNQTLMSVHEASTAATITVAMCPDLISVHANEAFSSVMTSRAV